jgi:hypothetical protein
VSVATEAVGPATGPRPLTRRVRDTFVAPRRLAAGLTESTPWIDVLVITTVIAMVAAALLPAEYFLAQVEAPVDRLGRPVEVTSPPEEIVRWGRMLQMFSAAVMHPMIVVMVAGLLTLLFSVVGGGGVDMRRYLALSSHAFLISALGVLLATAWQIATGAPEVQPSLAPLIGPSAESSFALRVLALLNPFTLWMLGVLAIGVSELDRRRGFAAAAGVLLGLYLALAAALASLG